MRHQAHATGLALHGKCGMAYRYRYVEQLKIPPAGRMISGSAAHRGGELDMEQLWATGGLLTDEELEDYVATDFSERWEWANEVDIQGNEGPDPRGFYLDRALRLARLRHEKLAPDLAPLGWEDGAAVEVPFSLRLKDADMELVGTIDLMTEGRAAESYVIRDGKNQAKSPAADDADKSLQLTVYSIAGVSLFEKAPEKLCLDVAVDLKSGPKMKTLDTWRDPADSARMIARRVQRLQTVIETGAYAPADPSAWWCSKAWCGYWDRCPFAQRPVSIGFAGPETGGE